MEHSAKSESLLVTFNKEKKEFTRVPFGDITPFPIILMDEEIGVKAVVDFDEETQEFLLDLNGECYEDLVYLDPSFTPEDKEVKLIKAEVRINGKQVLDGSAIEWLPHTMQFAIYSQIGEDEPIKSIEIKNVSVTTAAVMNELIGLLAMQRNLSETTLQELIFNSWQGISEPLDDSLLQELFAKCHNLTKLEVRCMQSLPAAFRMTLA